MAAPPRSRWVGRGRGGPYSLAPLVQRELAKTSRSVANGRRARSPGGQPGGTSTGPGARNRMAGRGRGERFKLRAIGVSLRLARPGLDRVGFAGSDRHALLATAGPGAIIANPAHAFNAEDALRRVRGHEGVRAPRSEVDALPAGPPSWHAGSRPAGGTAIRPLRMDSYQSN